MKKIAEKVASQGVSLVKETGATSWELLKITIPVVCVTKLLQELGGVALLSNILDPVMGLMGLPGALGLVWATAMLTNLYGAMVVFAALAPDLAVTTAQATVLCSALLIAHALPLELAITKRSGVAFLPIAALRLAGAFLYGVILNIIFSVFSFFQDQAVVIFSAGPLQTSFLVWMAVQLKNFALIVMVIFVVLVVMRILRVLKILNFLEWLLEPVLPFFGMSKRAAPVTVVGMIMGISYGGALIIKEAHSGRLEPREIFFSLALMGLCHALIEDTLLMMAMGAHWSGVLIGRVVFSLLVISLLAFVTIKFSARGVQYCRKNDK